MFRFLRVRLEQEMPAYTFQGGIVENAMDYSYFQCASPALKGLGLKLAVVFVHRPFRLEVWLSGRNRACQQQWHKRLQAGGTPLSWRRTRPGRTTFSARAVAQRRSGRRRPAGAGSAADVGSNGRHHPIKKREAESRGDIRKRR